MKNKLPLTLILFLIFGSVVLALLNDSPSQYKNLGKTLAEEKGCVSCHGVNGISGSDEYPNLAGQSRDYLASRLQYFKDNIDQIKKIAKTTNHIIPAEMLDQVMGLSNQEMQALAQYYSQLKPMYKQILNHNQTTKR